MDVSGRISRAVGEEAAKTAELLLRLSPSPRGLSSIAVYRQRFVAKYGHDRTVRLSEVLDPHRGLGPSAGFNYMLVAPEPAVLERRNQALLEMACSAMRSRLKVVNLDEALMKRLETWKPDAATAPISLDLNLLVAACSVEHIDQGKFLLVVGPNLGAQAAGRNLGRFAELIGVAGIVALQQVDEMERTHVPNEILAEVSYLPTNTRMANVVIRPPVREYELPVGITPGVSPSQVIPLDELYLGVEGERFRVYWPASGKVVRFTSGHMLSYRSAPPLVRLLSELAADGHVTFSSFDWGQAESFDYLPRVQFGRIVLRAAQWRLSKTVVPAGPPLAFRQALSEWRETWDVPRHVCLSNGDNRLILDLEQDLQVAELRGELEKLPAGRKLALQEVLPALNETWLKGAEGGYYSELIVSLSLRPRQEAKAEGVPAVQRVIAKMDRVRRFAPTPTAMCRLATPDCIHREVNGCS